MRRHGGMPFSGRTDADGRYRISGHQAEFMYIHLGLSQGRFRLPRRQRHAPGLAGRSEVPGGQLRPGKGAADPRQGDRPETPSSPSQGAAVMYQPASKNPNNKHGYDLRNTVLTDWRGQRSASPACRREECWSWRRPIRTPSERRSRARCMAGPPIRMDRSPSTYPRRVSPSRWRSRFARASTIEATRRRSRAGRWSGT